MKSARIGVLAALLLLFSPAVGQGLALVEVEGTQHLRRVEGIVRDQQGNVVPEVEVQLRTRNSGKVLKSTWSRIDGHFWFLRVAKGDYDLYLRANGWNPMLYHVRIDREGSKDLLIVNMHIAN